MNYDELAQRVVALGVGSRRFGCYWTDSDDDAYGWITPEEFCKDGRTVLAMMQMVCAATHGFNVFQDWQTRGYVASVEQSKYRNWSSSHNDSLAVAILTACCDALEGEK